jgi:hypothetical protein
LQLSSDTSTNTFCHEMCLHPTAHQMASVTAMKA